jgi:hypothetical protein
LTAEGSAMTSIKPLGWRSMNSVRVRSKKPEARGLIRSSDMERLEVRGTRIPVKPLMRPFWLLAPDFRLPYPAAFERDIKAAAVPG